MKSNFVWNSCPLEVDGCDRGNKQHLSFSLDARQCHRNQLRPLCMHVLSKVREVQLLVDIDACKVSLRFLPLLGHSLWDVVFSTNVCFLSGPCSTALIFQPPDLVQFLKPSCKANVPLTPTKSPLCSPCAMLSRMDSCSLMAQSPFSSCWIVLASPSSGSTTLPSAGQFHLPCAQGRASLLCSSEIFISEEGVDPFFFALR